MSEQEEKGKDTAMRPRHLEGGLVAYVQHHAWLGFLALGILGLAFASFLYVTAQPPELETFERITGVSWAETLRSLPGMAEYVSITIQSEAQFQLGFLIFMIAVAAVPYRKGETWAWYAMWVVPALLITLALRVALAGGMGWTLIAFQLVIALGALIVPYRIFFPRVEDTDALEGGPADAKEA